MKSEIPLQPDDEDYELAATSGQIIELHPGIRKDHVNMMAELTTSDDIIPYFTYFNPETGNDEDRPLMDLDEIIKPYEEAHRRELLKTGGKIAIGATFGALLAIGAWQGVRFKQRKKT